MKNINEKHKLIFFIYNYDYTVLPVVPVLPREL